MAIFADRAGHSTAFIRFVALLSSSSTLLPFELGVVEGLLDSFPTGSPVGSAVRRTYLPTWLEVFYKDIWRPGIHSGALFVHRSSCILMV